MPSNIDGIVVRNTVKICVSSRIKPGYGGALTVKSSIDERHVHAEELNNRFARKQHKRTDEGLNYDVLPAEGEGGTMSQAQITNDGYLLSVIAIKDSAYLANGTLLDVHVLPHPIGLPFKQNWRESYGCSVVSRGRWGYGDKLSTYFL